MIIYESNVADFKNLALSPKNLAEMVSHNLLDKFGIRVGKSEVRSWMSSLPTVSELIDLEENDYRKVLIEFNIPTSKQRVDFILLGKNKDGKPSAWILELKQWSKITEEEWNEFRVGRYIDSHPSGQAFDYQNRLNHEMGLYNKIDIKSSAFLHNLKTNDSPLYKSSYKNLLEKAALYNYSNKDQLKHVLNHHTIIRDGIESFNLLKEANWRPSKEFKEQIKEEFNSINLVGTQKLIYDKIEMFIKNKKHDEKITFLISGDPGSGKTIVAFKLLLLLVNELELKIQLMIPGQEVRAAFIEGFKDRILSTRISGSVMNNDFEAAIIDEAHKAVARDTGIVNYQRIYQVLKFGIIFIDDDQVINRKGITKNKVKEIATKSGHKVYEYSIEENFRNAGERTLLDWIDHIFYNRQTINGDYEYKQIKYINKNLTYKLYGYKNVNDFVESYYRYWNNNGQTRLTSLWSEEFYVGPADENGNVLKHILLGKHSFAWNPNEEWWNRQTNQDKSTYSKKTITYASDRKQFLLGNPEPWYIAYFNHIQGFEFENIFVYIPNIFTYRNGEIIFHRDRLAKEVKASQTWSPFSKSKELNNQDPNKLNKIYFLNRIKVMLTRGTKSTHVFAEDEALNKYIYDSIED